MRRAAARCSGGSEPTTLVGVARERAGDAADRVERGGGDQAAARVARLPQLGQRELQQRQAALGARRWRRPAASTSASDSKPHAVGLGRPDDRLAHAVRPQRAQEVERARQRRRPAPAARRGGVRKSRARRRRAGARPGTPAASRASARSAALASSALGQRDQLLELVDEQRPGRARRPSAARSASRHGRAVDAASSAGARPRRASSAPASAAASARSGRRPGSSWAARPGASAAQRAVARRRAARRRGTATTCPTPESPVTSTNGSARSRSSDRADLRAAAEEQRAVLGLERRAGRGTGCRRACGRRAPRGSRLLERVAQLVGRGEALVRDRARRQRSTMAAKRGSTPRRGRRGTARRAPGPRRGRSKTRATS